MAKDGTEAYVQQYLSVLAQDVKEQNERIAELDAWLEAEDLWEHQREKTISVLSEDIERCREATQDETRRIAVLKKRIAVLEGTPGLGVVRWNQHARHAEERNEVAVEVGQCWFASTPVLHSINAETPILITPIPINESRMPPRRSTPNWSADEDDALIAAITKQCGDWYEGSPHWQEVSSDLAELGYAIGARMRKPSFSTTKKATFTSTSTSTSTNTETNGVPLWSV